MGFDELGLAALKPTVGRDQNQRIADGGGERLEVARLDRQQMPAERFAEVHRRMSAEIRNERTL